MAGPVPEDIVVAIPIFKGFTATDAIGPYESLNLVPNVKVFFVSHTTDVQVADSGTLQIKPSHSFRTLPYPTIIIVPGGGGANALALDEDKKGLRDEIIAWILEAHKKTYYTASVCTGALLLGAAGLLKGLKATTHYTAYDKLRNLGADVAQNPDRVIFQGKIATAGGVSSGIDLGIQLVSRLAGQTTAEAATLNMEYDPEPPYNTGSVEKASDEVVALANKLYRALLARPSPLPPVQE